MTPRKRKTLKILAIVLLLLAVSRELGLIELNFYKAQSRSSTSLTTHGTPRGDVSFEIALHHEGEELRRHLYIRGDGDPETVSLDLSLTWDGWTWVPLYKSFALRYECSITSTSRFIGGNADGRVTFQVTGFCSRLKAQELALNAILDRLVDSVADKVGT